MKKIVLFFAAIVLCGLTLKAQLKKNHDSADRRDMISRLIINHDTKNNYPQGLKSAAVYQKLDSAVRPNMYKEHFIYDSEKRNVQYISSDWQNQHWVNTDKEEYSYDVNGNLSSGTGYNWNASTSQWIIDLKGELTYYNNLISSQIVLEWKNNQWTNSYKIEYTYNSDSNCTSEYGYDWDTITTQWNNIETSDYVYDNYGKRIQRIYWNYEMPYSVKTKTTYLYDTSGNMNLYTDYDWDISTNTWLLSYKGEFTYDSNNRPILTIHYLPVGVDQWIYARKIVYTYSYTVSPNNIILPCFRETYYDEFIDITAASFTMRIWNENTNDWDITYTKDKYFSDFDLNAPLLLVSTNIVNIGSAANSPNTFDITSNLSWTVACNQSWLTISDETGTGNKKITVTATANPTSTPRTATVTVSATGVPSQTIFITQADSPFTVNVSAGGLSTALTETELASSTKLKLTGTIDARDFKTMRDNMPLLAELDLNNVTIATYTGMDGTAGTSSTTYPANTIPNYAFFNNITYLGKTSLNSCLLPNSVISIGNNAFYYCSSLTSVNIPLSTISIGSYAFNGCSGLTSVTIPSTVTTIGSSAFQGCSGSIIVDMGNPNYSGLTGVLFNKGQTLLIQCPTSKTGNYSIPSTVNSIGSNAFYNCSGLTSVTIPTSVTSIGVQSFWYCSGLTSINIPSSVTYIGGFTFTGCTGLTSFVFPSSIKAIGDYTFQNCSGLKTVTIPSSITSIGKYAFTGCTGLSSIYASPIPPVDLISSLYVFNNVNKSTCKLYVPLGSSVLYSAANQWKDFTNIVEMAEFKLSATSATLAAAGGTTNVNLTTGLAWTASSDKTWLTISSASGTGNKTFTFTATANSSFSNRIATVTISATDIQSQTFIITQSGAPKTLAVNAGGLSTALTSEELTGITKLILTGTIDTRDFKTMRDDMPLLAEIDLRNVIIAAYTGTQGTGGTSSINYPSNTVPYLSFRNPVTNQAKISLNTVTLPSSITSIGNEAFSYCEGLTSINIPPLVTSIGNIAFGNCTRVTSINIPSSVTTIGIYAFGNWSGLINVDLNNPNFSSSEGVLYNKTKTAIIQCPTSITGSYVIPSSIISIGAYAFSNCLNLTSGNIPLSVTSIGMFAFSNCSGLNAINIPASVTYIGLGAFAYCRNVGSIYAYAVSPVNLSSSPRVFENINLTTTTLFVPFGTKVLYSAANQWQDFTNIVEMPGFAISASTAIVAATQSSTATVELTSNTSWTASSDKTWLVVSPTSGTGNSTLFFTAEANPLITNRTATVTVSATGVPSQTIIVTQPALRMQVTVFLEGAYTGSGLMNTALKAGALIPLSQPYNVAPWNYAGTETVASVPAGVVDWVLVELRQAATPEAALPGTTTLPGWPKACFLKSDGSIVDPDGTTLPALGNPTITGNLYVIIRHRNHVAIMSAAGMTLTGSNYVYNFTDAIAKAHGGSAGYRQIVPGVFGMVSGDPDADGEISVLDFSEWATNFGRISIYLPSDIDEDGEVSVLDYSKWATNFGVGNIPPLKLKKSMLQGTVRKYKSQVPDVK